MSTPTHTDAASARPALRRLDRRTPLREYLHAMWVRREFATVVPLGDLRAQNMDTVLGNLWHLLNPLLLVSVYYLVFGVILDTSRGVDNFITFLAVGIFAFQYTQKSMTSGSRAIVANEGLLRSIQFPRALLPLSTVVGQALAFLPTILVALVVTLSTGEPVRPTWLLLPFIFALQSLFNVGGVFVVARATAAFRDVANLLPYVFRLLFYMSGILYSVDAMVANPTYRGLFNLNPMYAFITLARGPLLGTSMPGVVWASVMVWTTVLLFGGFAFFRAAEDRYGRS